MTGIDSSTALARKVSLAVALGLLTMAMLPLQAQVTVSPAPPNIPSAVFYVTNYGAVGDGITTNTAAINAAVLDAASTNSGGTVEIPYVPGAANVYLSGSIKLKNKVNLKVDAGVTLRMLKYSTWISLVTGDFISAGSNPSDVEISGSGTIDGQADTSGWWQSPTLSTSVRPYLINLSHCARVMIRDVTLENSPKEHITIGSSSSTDVTIEGITINTPVSPNTDGMDLTGKNELVENCSISDGDDNIALTSTTANVVITNCSFGIGHGVSIGGTTGPGGVSNIMVINCSFNGTDNGIRIKSDNGIHGSSPVTGGPCNNLYYYNLTMTNLNYTAILIYSYYNVAGGNLTTITPAVAASESVDPIANPSETPVYRSIVFSNITASVNAGGVAGLIWGRTELPATNIIMDRVNITAPQSFEVYNAYQIQFIDSQITPTTSGQATFVPWNAGIVVTNTVLGTNWVTIGGTISTNQNLELDHVLAAMTSSSVFGATPIILNGATLTNSGNLVLSNIQDFVLGSTPSEFVVHGNLALNGTNNFIAGNGFTATNYSLYTYTGSLTGTPVLGAVPVNYNCRIDTNTPGLVQLVATRPPAPLIGGIAPVNAGSGNVVINGSGVTNGIYVVLMSTNVALPLNQWQPIATNPFDGNGNFSFTNAIANLPGTFYLLELP